VRVDTLSEARVAQMFNGSGAGQAVRFGAAVAPPGRPFVQESTDDVTDDTAPPVPIRKFPTRLSVRCVECGHCGEVFVFLGKAAQAPVQRCAATRVRSSAAGAAPGRAAGTKRKLNLTGIHHLHNGYYE
jgi:hypothetical protein